MSDRLTRQHLRLDVNFDEDPALSRVTPFAQLVFIKAIAYAVRTGSDGYVPVTAQGRFGKRAGSALKQLADVGVMEQVQDGYVIRSFASWQMTQEAIAQVRAANAERKRLQRERMSRRDSDGTSRSRPTTEDKRREDKRSKPMSPTGQLALPATPDVSSPSAITKHDDAGALIGEWLGHCEQRPPKRIIGQVSRDLRALLDEGQPYALVRAGLAAWASSDQHPSTLASFVHRAGKRRGTTDQRVADGLSLVERFEREDEGA